MLKIHEIIAKAAGKPLSAEECAELKAMADNSGNHSNSSNDEITRLRNELANAINERDNARSQLAAAARKNTDSATRSISTSSQKKRTSISNAIRRYPTLYRKSTAKNHASLISILIPEPEAAANIPPLPIPSIQHLMPPPLHLSPDRAQRRSPECSKMHPKRCSEICSIFKTRGKS